MHGDSAGTPWSPLARIAFRFVFLYFAFAFFSAILQLVPLLGMVGYWHDQAVQPFYAWIGKVVFGLEITVFPNGSGDTTYNWVQSASHVVFALTGAAIWSVIDWRRVSYPWLKDGLWIAMRFVLASAMFGYGINKVFGLQFPEPGMQRLLQDYGDSSPMGLLWTFMGASQPYTMFAGWMETIGGLLLCFRRTQLVGALWTAGVMANVFVLNMCYDIPVKLYSLHLLLLALVIAAPDMPRLLRMFLLNKPVSRADLHGPWTKPWLRRTAFGVKFAWVGFTVPFMFWQMSEMRYTYGALAPRGALDGTWEVVEFRRDGVELPPVVTDATRWRFFTIIDRPDWKQAIVTHMKGVNGRWQLEIKGDTEPAAATTASDDAGSTSESASTKGALELREMTVAAGDDATKAPLAGTLAYTRESEKSLRVTGEIAGARIEAICERRDPQDFLLMNRGFHWINEFPFNR
jgi:hypothetical protein